MGIIDTGKAQKSLSAGQRANGNQESELQVCERPQFRASNIMAHAPALYNLETVHTVSQTMSMAFRQFLPEKYVASGANDQMCKGTSHMKIETKTVATATEVEQALANQTADTNTNNKEKL